MMEKCFCSGFQRIRIQKLPCTGKVHGSFCDNSGIGSNAKAVTAGSSARAVAADSCDKIVMLAVVIKEMPAAVTTVMRQFLTQTAGYTGSCP